ncbi:MAG: 3-hydroxyacyl-CoA dehydrogenase/enoyl-CoA hydratase family protein [Blastocatellia bacterium]|nr:3-hydroxyacyl-CoA dehydrogenase/enoyl-CoA hydratase family protein [Blastocatellia bacterium]
MAYKIEKVAVLGSGVMGAQIAAHLVNAGYKVLLLDILPSELVGQPAVETKPAKGEWGHHHAAAGARNRVASQAVENMKKMKPAPFFVPELAGEVRVGNFEDDLPKVAEADWIIEAIIERLDIKRSLYEKVDKFRRKGSIVSSNTSGISIRGMSEGMSEDFRKHFLGTHFFNPPRYMKLLEIISTPETLPEVVDFVADFCDRRLGKGVAYAKDTPNFIANRIGTFGMMYTMKVMLEDGYTIEEVDKITGPVVGRPKTAAFRTLDLVGLDTFSMVASNVHSAVIGDEKRDVFQLPEFVKQMVEKKWLGNKSKQGFYKKVKGESGDQILALDVNTLEYRPQQKVKYPSHESVKPIENLRERLKTLVYGEDPVGKFLWKTLSETFIYSANRIPEIADDIVQIDNALKWGFNWELGVFESWDAIGVEKSVERLKTEGRVVPEFVSKLLASGKKSFYERREGYTYYFDYESGDYKKIDDKPGLIILPSLKERNKVVKRNPGASLIDIGDGVACLEFHSKMNSIGGDTVSMMNFAIKEVGQNFEGLVVGNQGENFSAGANIMMLLLAAQEEEWDEIDLMIRSFQNANMQLRYSDKPVVTAPFGLALGGGCEVTMHGDRARPAAETYIGLVEIGVGLIPAGGGTKELVLRATEQAAMESAEADPFPYIKQAFESIATAKVATSAMEGRKYGFIRKSDPISMSRDRQIDDAKQMVLAMVREGYRKPEPKNNIVALGEAALSALKLGVHLMVQAGYATEYEGKIARKIAYVLTGGDLSYKTTVSEQYLLDLEREAFLSLCGERKTQERIQSMLKTGKALRN